MEPYPGHMAHAHGFGLLTTAADGTVLDTYFPKPEVSNTPPSEPPPESLTKAAGADAMRDVSLSVELISIDTETPPQNVPDAYLRLHLLSHRLVTPHGVNLEGIFGVLTNVAWTHAGPAAVSTIEETRMRYRAAGSHLQVYGIDKFPRMVDYVVPSGVRIADADRVRLGAHLAEGTTVMHEGFVNFNAGTLGASMVEGRISAGVVIGDGSDVGGGASIMGTLSGGGTEVISIGKRSLLGANSGLGIPLGNDCVVEAGLYVTAGSKVRVIGSGDSPIHDSVVKARELAGAHNLLFRRNSQTGEMEAVERSGAGVTLNSILHAN